MVVPGLMLTMSPVAGRRPGDQTAGSDHLPLLTLTMVGAAPKLGIFSHGVVMKADVTGGGKALETWTLTGAEVAVLPAGSRTVAASVCVPLPTVVVSHE